MLFINRSFLFAIFILSTLVACGGGGSGDDSDSNESDATAPSITIIGDNPVTVDRNTTYVDAGATAIDDIDGIVSVASAGTVDTGTVGSYEITYTATDAAGNSSNAIRTVNVVDATAPSITIIGDNPVTVGRNTIYVDAGATAIDDIDGVVSVTSAGTVDIGIVGSYEITYTATDAAGNSATAIRTVNVADVINSGGAIGTALSPGLVDVDGDGIADIDFVSFGVDSGFLDATASFGLVGNIGGSPGSGAAWVRGTSDIVTADGVGRNEIIAEFRGALANSDDNWSKVHFSSGEGWVQWEFGATIDVVTPVVFVREGANQDLSAAEAAFLAYPSEVITSGGAIGTALSPGLVDVDGDGIADIDFVSFGVDSGFLDATASFGLVGNIGGSPGSGAAWVRGTSDIVTVDGVGRNEIIAEFRGALANSDDNWSKVHFSSGEGWVQWEFGATIDVVTPVVFVREGANQDLSAAGAVSLTLQPVIFRSGGAIGTALSPGLVDVDGDGIADIDFVSFGVDSGFLDATASFGLVGNIGGSPGSGAAWVRGTSDIVTVDGVGRNEIIAEFRGALANSDDNWSKVHFSSGEGWVQWEFGATIDVVTPVVFVREGANQDLSAAEAAFLAYPSEVITSGGAIGTALSPGLVDVDGDGIADIDFVSFGVDSGFLDATASFGLVGNIGGSPGSGAAWVRGTSDIVTADGVGRNEIIAEFRGALANSDDNWSKVHFSSGEGWVQWEFGATIDVVTPVVFVREGVGRDLSATEADSLVYP